MKLWLILASLVSVGVCQLVGGKTDVDPAKYRAYFDKVLLLLPDYYPCEIEIVLVQRQVVAGIKTYITLEVKGRPCEIVLYDRAWEDYHEVVSNTCLPPGSYRPVDDLAHPKVQKALVLILDEINNWIKSEYRVTESKILSVERQVVAGYNYRIKMVVKESVCLNNEENQHLMSSDCPSSTNSNEMPMKIYAIVYSKLMSDVMEITKLKAKRLY